MFNGQYIKDMDIRNFAIIAHIDHGKSTLADRLLEYTHTIEKRDMKDQVLDTLDLERERGITIKMQPVRMRHRFEGKEYILNMIDTPGHIDFSYEVSRSMRAVEGAVVLVDITQGVQAQTLSVLQMAKEAGLVLIPVFSKVDMVQDPSEYEALKKELLDLTGSSEVLETSGKDGSGVDVLIQHIIERVPPPQTEGDISLGLIFDFSYSSHTGICAFVRVKGGSFKKGDSITLLGASKSFVTKDIGIFSPNRKPTDVLTSGEIGYITSGIKEPGVAVVGDTVVVSSKKGEPLSGYEHPKPVIWASVFPEDAKEFVALEKALSELHLADAAFMFEEERSGVLGKGFRCGFLGMLHLEIITERIAREFGIQIITTSPISKIFVTTKKGEKKVISNPIQFPETHEVEAIEEAWVSVRISFLSEQMSEILKLLTEYEIVVGDTEDSVGNKSALNVEMPLRELMRNFFDALKSASNGYGSLSYSHIGNRKANLTRLDVLIADEVMPSFSKIVSKNMAYREGKRTVEALKKHLPRQLFLVKIQARVDGRILASETLSALRKDVTGHLYGGDRTRRMKLLEKQKKGKKKMQRKASVRVPHEVFLKVLRGSTDR